MGLLNLIRYHFIAASLVLAACPVSHLYGRDTGDTGIEFEDPVLLLGERIEENGGPVRGVVFWKNTGNGPVILTGITTTCGCVDAGYVKRKVLPGERDSIVVTYFPKGHPGRFSHKMFLYSSRDKDKPSAMLGISGNVLPASLPVWRYPYQMGILFLKQKTVYMDGDKPQVEVIECLNAGDRPFSLDKGKSLVPPCFSLDMYPATVAPGETADIEIIFRPGKESDIAKKGKLPIVLGGLGQSPGESTIYVIFGRKPEISTEVL